MKKWQEKLNIGIADVENRAGILYNETVDQRDVAQLGSAFVLGTKYHHGRIVEPVIPTYSSPLGSHEGSIEINSDIHHFHFMRLYASLVLGVQKSSFSF